MRLSDRLPRARHVASRTAGNFFREIAKSVVHWLAGISMRNAREKHPRLFPGENLIVIFYSSLR
ncbi:hypothetical protein PUN28_010551 [Cardiocondyla obscurior]|uniref:Uncharacterized protein n=1 Tax=Cardiocondyla obscurior TaxID=286306 RepID=A0AAW2FL03_9HYME